MRRVCHGLLQKNETKSGQFHLRQSRSEQRHLQHMPTISNTFPSSWTFIEIERKSSMLLMSCVLLYSPNTIAFSKFPWAMSIAHCHPFFVWYKMQSYVVLLSKYCFSNVCKHSSPLSRSSFRSLSFRPRFWSKSNVKQISFIQLKLEFKTIWGWSSAYSSNWQCQIHWFAWIARPRPIYVFRPMSSTLNRLQFFHSLWPGTNHVNSLHQHETHLRLILF